MDEDLLFWLFLFETKKKEIFAETLSSFNLFNNWLEMFIKIYFSEKKFFFKLCFLFNAWACQLRKKKFKKIRKMWADMHDITFIHITQTRRVWHFFSVFSMKRENANANTMIDKKIDNRVLFGFFVVVFDWSKCKALCYKPFQVTDIIKTAKCI